MAVAAGPDRHQGLLSGSPAKDSARHVLAGALAGFVSKLFEYPMVRPLVVDAC